MLNGNFVYIDNHELLKEVVKTWEGTIAVDLECENNLHHYGLRLALVQISTKKGHWIIDAISIKDLSPFKEILEDKDKLKLFHDVNFDFEVLAKQLNCKPKNVFDTQVAALLLGKDELGLGPLLAEYFNVKKEKKFQKADWTKRPISKEMLSYAINDTTYLIGLYEELKSELKALGRYEWAVEEMNCIEKKDYFRNGPSFLTMKGTKDINDKERAIMKRLYDLREKYAQSVDRPVHFIINNRLLKELAMHPPADVKAWKNLRQVHPVVKQNASEFVKAVELGKTESIKIERKVSKRFSPTQKKHIEVLTKLRDKIANDLKMRPYLILNKEQIHDVVVNGNNKSMKNWQKEVLKINDSL